MIFKFRILLFMTLITLTSCGTHKMQFDCKASNGMGCKSVSAVNEHIDNTRKSGRESGLVYTLSDNNQNHNSIINTDNNLDQNLIISSRNNLNNTTNDPDNSIIRSQEKILKIWINNYVDSSGNFRGSQYIYTVITPAHWEVK